ncbi:hypothetical protein MHU86_10940 [Fragilaria crotonensis]|nr:hypothetical protein MHU86_10940 [Fragilaria crotonensis]
MKHVILTILALLPLAHAQCPSTGGAISWNGPCTYETILQATGCALNSLGRSIEDVQEACDAAAFAFSSVNNVSRNFDERFFNGEGPFNDNRESDGPEAEMRTGANRLYRINDNVVSSRRILMPTYDSLLNYTYESYFGPGVKDKAFYDANETAREMVDDFPPYIANFNLTSDCKLKTMMCCFTDTRLTTAFEDNADVCAHDFSMSTFANNVKHGFGVYDSNAPTYCTAFKWDDDRRSASYQYRGNALFDISFGTFMRKGYVKNIPGAPLCSCIENMPIVTNAACRKLNVASERYTLNNNGTKISIVQNSVKVTFSDCGQDFKPFHYGASKNVTAEVDKRIVGSCPASKEKFLNDRFLVTGSSNKFDLPPCLELDASRWKGYQLLPNQDSGSANPGPRFPCFVRQEPEQDRLPPLPIMSPIAPTHFLSSSHATARRIDLQLHRSLHEQLVLKEQHSKLGLQALLVLRRCYRQSKRMELLQL